MAIKKSIEVIESRVSEDGRTFSATINIPGPGEEGFNPRIDPFAAMFALAMEEMAESQQNQRDEKVDG